MGNIMQSVNNNLGKGRKKTKLLPTVQGRQRINILLVNRTLELGKKRRKCR